MSSRKRIEWIDCVRAVSMMLIIVGHTYTAGFWQHLIYAINVPIFFVLSGYLTRRKTIVRTAKAGIRTLLVPYGVTALIIFLLSLISLHRHVPGMITTDHWYHYLIAALYGIGTPSNRLITRGQYCSCSNCFCSEFIYSASLVTWAGAPEYFFLYRWPYYP